MANESNPPSSKSLLTLKGQIIVHFIDGATLEGEFVTQDELNIFVKIDNEPVMIPRSQIRYIKGKSGQSIEQDESQAAASPDESLVDTPDTQPLPADIDVLDDTDATIVLLEEAEEPDDETVVLAETSAPDETAIISEVDEVAEVAFATQDDSLALEDDEDPTLVFAEEPPEIDDSEDVTFVLAAEEGEPAAEKVEEISGYLDCSAGPHAGEVFKLTSGITTIGRSSDNIISLFKDKEISRKHSKIIHESGHFVIEDQNSLNGTFVNGERVEGPRYLEDNDVILIGVSTLIYHDQ